MKLRLGFFALLGGVLAYWWAPDGQARLPPSGVTGFDPRLTPGWAAVPLPG